MMANKNGKEKKGKNLAGFGEVAGDSIKHNNDSNSDSEFMKDIVRGRKNKEDTHTYRGFYLENDLVRTMDRIAHDRPRGVKSDLVNAILREKFKEMGWLD